MGRKKKPEPRRTMNDLVRAFSRTLDGDALDERFGPWVRLMLEAKDSSDRGLAVLMISYLEASFEEFFLSKFPQPGSTLWSLTGVGGPLHCFLVRVRLAYTLGHVDRLELRTIGTLVEVRNRFGHDPAVDSFRQTEIAAKIAAMIDTFEGHPDEFLEAHYNEQRKARGLVGHKLQDAFAVNPRVQFFDVAMRLSMTFGESFRKG